MMKILWQESVKINSQDKILTIFDIVFQSMTEETLERGCSRQREKNRI
jgi:hypothetical protein